MRSSSKWLALVAFSLATLVIGLDMTVLAVALPTLARVLDATQSDLQWFSAAFSLTLAGGMLPASLIGDRLGPKKTLMAALLIFGGCAIWSACVGGPGQLILARALMGLAAALIVVITLGMIPVLFAPDERGKALAVMMGATFVGMPVGPVVGGWILEHFWWGWVFLMNVPVALVALVLVLVLVPEPERTAPREPVDLIGLVLGVGGLATVTYGLIEAGSAGWNSSSVRGWIVGGLIALVLMIGWETHMAATGQAPLVPPMLFRVPGFGPGTLIPWIGQLALVGLVFTLPTFLQAVHHVDAMGSGERMIPLIFGFIVAAGCADRLARHLGPRAVATTGYLIMGAGTILGARMTADSSDLFLAMWLSVTGFGLGLGLITAASVAVRNVPAERANHASAVFQALQKTGGPLGAAILGSVLSQVYQRHLHLPVGLPADVGATVRSGVFQGLAVADRLPAIGQTVQDSFVAGMHALMWVSVGIALAAAVASLALLPRDATQALGYDAHLDPGPPVSDEQALARTDR
ncbi:MAG: MFS transporter [Dermatophilaceae bacterium]